MFDKVIEFIRSLYPNQDLIPLHAPVFIGNERKYVLDAIDSTFVSSVGEYVNRFEEMICNITGSSHATATVNGTSALHVALKLAGVESGDEVITQALTFIATANAVAYCGAVPIFIDVDKETLGLSPEALKTFLEKNSRIENGNCYNILNGKRISACLPMHTFGHPCKIDKIVKICSEYNIQVVEDAAESIGSRYKDKHTGRFGIMGIFSFNGNKTVTCGGGGVIITDNDELASKAKHITTTAKINHPYEFIHDEIGYNYRLPNLNAALACAQLEQLKDFIDNKRELAQEYNNFFKTQEINFLTEPEDAFSNYWLNTIVLSNLDSRNKFLESTNRCGVMTRPCWRLMNKLKIYKGCQTDKLENAQWLEERIVNIPSSVRSQ